MKHSIFFAFLLCWSILNAQTTTYEIDYSYDVGLGSSCNVFSTEKTINGFKHQATKGFPNYIVNTQIGSHINLACKRNSSSSQTGTDYQILFPFKKNYKYQINVLYKSTYSSGEFSPMIGLKMNVTKKTHNTSTSCSGPQSIDIPQYEGQGASGSSFAWPSSPLISTGALTQDYESLSIASLPLPSFQSTGTQGIQVRTVRIVEIAPVSTTPPVNDEYSGAIMLTHNSTTSCIQQTQANFNNSTIDQLAYEFFGYNGGDNSQLSMLGDVWYKFTATSSTCSISASVPSSGYSIKTELYSFNNTLRIIDAVFNGDNLNVSGLEIGHIYYIRLILLEGPNNNKNVNSNICITTPVVSSATIKVKLDLPRYARTSESYPYFYDGNLMSASYLIPQNIPESDLVFDWMLVGPSGGIDPIVDGSFLYLEGDSPTNNGGYSLTNIQGRRVRVGFGPKSPGNEGVLFWASHVKVRVKQVSTNTYLTDWIEGGAFGTEL